MAFISLFIFLPVLLFISFAIVFTVVIAIIVATMSISFGTATSMLVKDKQVKKMTLLLSLNAFLLSSTFFLPLILGKLGATITITGIFTVLMNLVVVVISIYAFNFIKKLNHKGVRIGGYILFGLTLGFALFILLGIIVLALLLN